MSTLEWDLPSSILSSNWPADPPCMSCMRSKAVSGRCSTEHNPRRRRCLSGWSSMLDSQRCTHTTSAVYSILTERKEKRVILTCQVAICQIDEIFTRNVYDTQTYNLCLISISLIMITVLIRSKLTIIRLDKALIMMMKHIFDVIRKNWMRNYHIFNK